MLSGDLDPPEARLTVIRPTTSYVLLDTESDTLDNALQTSIWRGGLQRLAADITNAPPGPKPSELTVYAAQHAQNRDQVALVMAQSKEQLTFFEFEANANRLAHRFRALGLRRGDHVAILMENNLRYFEVMAAAERTGLYYTCINAHLTAEEAGYIVDDCDAEVLVTSRALLDVATVVAAMTSKVREFLGVDLEMQTGPFRPYDNVIADYPATHVPDEQLGAAMLYSSGTTGRPKGIMRPLPDARPDEQLPVMQFAQDSLLHMRPGMVYLSPAPIYHAAPQASVGIALRLGATTVIMEKFQPEQFLALVERYGVTHTNMVPTMFSRLLKLPAELRRRYDLSSLEVICHSAAPCPVPVKKAMIDWFGPVLYEYYGSTEGNGYTACDSTEWLAHPGTVGREILGHLQILDHEHRPVPTGQVGTVWFEGATRFSYYRDEEKTAQGRDESGQRSTVGDLGYLDEDGYLYLTDRATFMIVSGGVNIYPQEVEDLLVTHPKLEDAAVFGVPNADLGEEVKAVVQVVDGVQPGAHLERELIEFCRDRLAHYKCPRSVDFDQQLPRSPTGKLYKRLLRDRYWGKDTTRIV